MTDTSVVNPNDPVRLDPAAYSKWQQNNPVVDPAESASRELYQQEQSAGALKKSYDTHKGDMSALSKGVSAGYQDLSRATAHPPPQQPLPPRPDAREYEKNSLAFASSMALLGAVGTAFGRMNTTQSLNAFSGALKGWKEGNLSNYEQASQKWEQDTKAAIENNKQLTANYQAILNSKQLNIDAMMAQIKLKAAEYHDDIGYQLASTNNYTAFAALQDKRYKFTNDAETKFAPLVSEIRKNELEMSRLATGVLSGQINPDGLDPNTGQPYTEAQKSTFRTAVEVYERGGIGGKGMKAPAGGYKAQLAEEENQARISRGEPPMTPTQKRDFSLAPPRNLPAMVARKYLENHPNATDADLTKIAATYNEAQSRARTLGTRSANIDIAVTEAAGAAKQAIARSEAVPRGEFVPITQLQQAAQRAGSSKELQRFAIANASLITAYAQTMSRTGINTVTAQNRATELLSTVTGKEAYKAGVEQLLTEMQIVQDAVREVEGGGGAGSAGGAAPAGGVIKYDAKGNAVQ